MAVAPAYGWGKAAQRIISWTAIRALPADHQQMLLPFEQQLLDGATADDEVVSRYFRRGSVAETARSVSHEMNLLRTALRGGIDEYTAYRFGVLSQIVADLNEPFTGDLPLSGYSREDVAGLRRQYEVDVDRALQGVRYGYKRRKPVYDAEAYFAGVRRYLQQAELFLAQDYARGEGFSEYGFRSLNLYYDNSVNAVADVWFTILRPAQFAELIDPTSSAMGQYRINAVRYFLEVGRDRKAADIVAQLDADMMMDTETRKRVSDAYYDTRRHTRAIDGYLSVLDEQPNWPMVRARVSNYYYALGTAYMKGGLLAEAQHAFEHVLTHDPQYRPARLALDTTIGLIAAREERLNRTRSRMQAARASETRAKRAEAARDYATAMRHLRDAAAVYSAVTTEFRNEYRDAQRKLASIREQITKYSDTIIQEARALDTITEQMVLDASVNQAARKHAARFADEVIEASHDQQTDKLRREIVQKQKTEI